MKINIVMQCPDAIQTAIEKLVEENPDAKMGDLDKLADIVSWYFKYQETVTLQVDTDKATIKVLPARYGVS